MSQRERDKVARAQEAWKEALRAKAEIVQSALASPQGKALFELLVEAFEGQSLMGSDPYETCAKVARRDVVQYIRELNNVNFVKGVKQNA